MGETKKQPEEVKEVPLPTSELGKVVGGTPAVSAIGAVRTTGVDEVGLLTENRQPNIKPPTGGQ